MPKKQTQSRTKKKTLVLLDAHAILHRAYHALPDFSSPSGEPTGALYGVVAMLLKIVDELKPDHIAACFDLPEPTYRHAAFKEYKSGRKKIEDSLVAQIERSRDIFKAFNIPIYECPGFEADDMLGTIAHQMKKRKDVTVIIASGDMDTMQCIDDTRVLVYTLRKGIQDTVLYDEQAVIARFGFKPRSIPDYKGLRGDPSDNIPGIVGIGEKTATQLITAFGTIEKMYAALKKGEDAFLELGIKPRMIALLKEHEEEAEFSKMIATIREDAPITFDLPETHWKDSVDAEALLSLFTELGFRTLRSRLSTMLEVDDRVIVAEAESGVSKEAIIEAGVMLWLLESDRTDPSFEDIIEYGRSYFKTTDFSAIVKALTEALKKEGLYALYETVEMPLSHVISAMNRTGITLDTPYLAELSKVMHAELDLLQQKIFALAGGEFNINSPKQMGDILYDTLALKPKHQKKTASGQRSTRESELEKMKDDHPIIELLLRYRELQKLVSTYIDNLPTMVSEDGRLRTTFLQTGAATGRMASRDPGLQNIPVRTEEGKAIRKAFVAAKGYTLVSIDYSQIELRIAAIMTGDQKLIEIFKRGEDVHSGVASRVFGVPEGEVTSDMRRKAKVINFGILYGMGVNALRANLGEGTSREEAQEFLNAYFNTFTRLAEYLEETKEYAREHGYTVTLFGRKRRFPGIRSSAPFIRAQAERMAINAPIQGTAADVMRIAMNDIYAYIQTHALTDTVRMLLQVHDELVFEVKTDKLKSCLPDLIAIMEHALHGKDDRGVPLQVSVAVGRDWGTLEDWEQ